MMKAVEQLARAAADKDKVDPFKNGLWVLTTEELQLFHDLAIEQEHKRLLEGSGEPVAYRTEDSTNGVSLWLFKKTAVKYQDPPDNLYTADQLAAAVLRYKADAERWQAFRSAGSDVTLRLHNSRADQRDAAIDAAIRGQK